MSQFLKASDKALKWCERMMCWVGASALAMLLGITLFEVFKRNVLGKPIHGLVDMVEWFMPFAALAGIGAAQAAGEHFRMEILVKAMPKRIRWIVEAFSSAAALFFTITVSLYTIKGVMKAFSVGYISADLEWPLWPPKLALALFFTLLSCRLALQTLGLFRLSLNSSAEPIGIPENLKPGHDVEGVTL